MSTPAPHHPDISTAIPTTEPGVHWFGQSHRMIGGRPDTRYGWLDTAQGPCIVKALDLDLAAYSGTLLHNEREVLRHLIAAGAPVPELVDDATVPAREDWLVTRFAGVSLQVLQHSAPAAFPFEERLTAWIHFLRRARAFDEAGALPIDLWAANLVLPLTQTLAGQARLHQGVLIDHAHTVMPAMNLRRPVWMDSTMRRVAPELRAALQADQEALVHAFRLARTQLPGHQSPRPEALERTRRLWAEYDAPQQLQRLLDAGRLSRGAAMQYAVAVAVERLLPAAPGGVADALVPVLARMKAEAPQARFAGLDEAAAALQGTLRVLPLATSHHFGPLQPEHLVGPSGPVDPAKREDTRHWATALVATVVVDPDDLGTTLVEVVEPGLATLRVDARDAQGARPAVPITPPPGPAADATNAQPGPQRRLPMPPVGPISTVVPAGEGGSWLWLYLVGAVAAALGVLVPLPW